jgi:hypothetical protein
MSALAELRSHGSRVIQWRHRGPRDSTQRCISFPSDSIHTRRFCLLERIAKLTRLHFDPFVSGLSPQASGEWASSR